MKHTATIATATQTVTSRSMAITKLQLVQLKFEHWFIHSFIWKIYITPLKKSTQRCSQSNHG